MHIFEMLLLCLNIATLQYNKPLSEETSIDIYINYKCLY